MLRGVRNLSSSPSSRRQPLVGDELERCIFCQGTGIRREGRRYKKLETVQLWVFTHQRAKGKTYPLRVVLESLMLYYIGETREQTSKRIKERFGVMVPSRTLSNWIAEYRDLTPYARLREQGAAAFRPNRLIRAVRLHHQQVYEYRIHRGKLAMILDSREHDRFRPLEKFLITMADACPHRLFQTEARASQNRTAFDLEAVEIRSKSNHACRMADLFRVSRTTSAGMTSCSASC